MHTYRYAENVRRRLTANHSRLHRISTCRRYVKTEGNCDSLISVELFHLSVCLIGAARVNRREPDDANASPMTWNRSTAGAICATFHQLVAPVSHKNCLQLLCSLVAQRLQIARWFSAGIPVEETVGCLGTVAALRILQPSFTAFVILFRSSGVETLK